MPNLLETLVEIVGDEGKAKEVQSKLGEFMLPKTEYAKVRDQLKEKELELENIKVANMNEKQKIEHELAKAQAIQKEYSIKTNRLEAEKLFVGAGVAKEDYENLLVDLISEDGEKSLKLVNNFISVLGKEKQTVADKTKQEIIDKTKTPQAGDDVNPSNPKMRTSF